MVGFGRFKRRFVVPALKLFLAVGLTGIETAVPEELEHTDRVPVSPKFPPLERHQKTCSLRPHLTRRGNPNVPAQGPIT